MSHVWVWYAVVGVVITVATVAAIRGGLTARHAMTAIRLAHSDVMAACSAHPDATMPKALQEAEASISTAYEALAARRYEETIAAASQARQLARVTSSQSP